MNLTLERMDDFFTKRVAGYDEHMIKDVEGCANGYKQMARLLAARIEDVSRVFREGNTVMLIAEKPL